MNGKNPFVCPKCGYADSEFHTICPECGRPFMRDYTDTQMHPRDPDPTGVVTMKFWARVFLVFMAGGLFLGVLRLSGLL